MNENSQNFDAIILAAGFGTRLRPLTDTIPKPAIPLFGIPAIKFSIAWLKKAGAKRVGINVHHLGSVIEKMIESGLVDCDRLFIEPEIRGTAGAYLAFEDWLHENIILSHNSDILHDIHVSQVDKIISNTADSIASLALTDKFDNLPANIGCNHGLVKSIRGKLSQDQNLKMYSFMGIQALNKEALPEIKKLPFPSDIFESYISAYTNGAKISYCEVDPTFCFDIGTVKTYLETHFYGLEHALNPFGLKKLLSDQYSSYLYVPPGQTEDIGGLTIQGPALLADVDVSCAKGSIGPFSTLWNVKLDGDFKAPHHFVAFEGKISGSDVPSDSNSFVYTNKQFTPA